MLPENDADARQQILLHGLFHHIQPELGLTPSDGFNEHLDTLEGRVWMQLEWRALTRAVESSGTDQSEAIADALAFRSERRRLFPGAADNERRDEIREGLASYTGVAAWADSPAEARRNQQAIDDGCRRGSGALPRCNAANRRGGARSGAANTRR
jgi:hypothetical protein